MKISELIIYIGIICSLLSINCIWVVYSKEEIEEKPFNLAPLPDSLLLLPDSSANKVLIIRLGLYMGKRPPSNYIYFQNIYEDYPIIIYQIYNDGTITTSVGLDRRNDVQGQIDISNINELILGLNNIGFFNISPGYMSPYYDVRKYYLCGFLIKKQRIFADSYPELFYKIKFIFKNFHYEIYYDIPNPVDNNNDILHPVAKQNIILRLGFQNIENTLGLNFMKIIE